MHVNKAEKSTKENIVLWPDLYPMHWEELHFWDVNFVANNWLKPSKSHFFEVCLINITACSAFTLGNSVMEVYVKVLWPFSPISWLTNNHKQQKSNLSKHISLFDIGIFHALTWFQLKNESAKQNSDRWVVVLPGDFISLVTNMIETAENKITHCLNSSHCVFQHHWQCWTEAVDLLG